MRAQITGLALAALGFAAGVTIRAAAQPIQLLPPTIGNGPIVAVSDFPVYADAHAFLLSARSATERGRTAEATEALERAETRLLGRATAISAPVESDDQRSVQLIETARRSLAVNDRLAALRAIDDALAATDMAEGPEPLAPLADATPIPAPVIPPPGAVPTITSALLAGHWALDGADWKWVPPETVLRRVQTVPRIAGQYVWQDQRYVWVPAHYAN